MISEEPSKVTPLIALPVCSLVAVEALPFKAPIKLADVTEVSPSSEFEDAPSEMDVVPMVTAL